MCAANWGFFLGGGGLNIFFRGRNVHQVFQAKRGDSLYFFLGGRSSPLQEKRLRFQDLRGKT